MSSNFLTVDTNQIQLFCGLCSKMNQLQRKIQRHWAINARKRLFYVQTTTLTTNIKQFVLQYTHKICFR